MTIDCLTSFQAAETIRAEWDQLVAAVDCAIYQSFDWCRIWWRHYGEGRSLHLLLCREGNSLCGVMPLFGETLVCGPIRLRILKPIGADHTPQHCDVPCQARALPSLLRHLKRHFLESGRYHLIRFGPLGAGNLTLGHWEASLKHAGFHHSLHPCPPLTRFEVPASTDDFWQSLPGKLRRECAANWRKLTTLHRCRESVVAQADLLPAAFAEFHQLHQFQWSQAQASGHFGDWPRALAFNRDLSAAFGDLGQVAFFRISLPDSLLTSQFAFIHHRTCHWRLPARDPSPRWSSFGLGQIALARMIHHAVGLGVDTIEAGQGHYPYKSRFGGREIPLHRISCCLPEPVAMLRCAIADWISALIHLAYYRIWFRKLRHITPGRHLPLHPAWIRWS